MNDNSFHVFDENKPAWIAHTTLPHTLAGAMINITLPWWPTHATESVTLLDPFAGTGTVFLESLKHPELLGYAFDNEPISQLLVADNLDFFCRSPKELDELDRRLEELSGPQLRPPASVEKEIPREVAEAYEWMRGLLPRSEIMVGAIPITRRVIHHLEKKDLFFRIVFYLAVRTQVRHFPGMVRGTDEWTRAYLHELEELRNQLARLKQRIQRPPAPNMLRTEMPLSRTAVNASAAKGTSPLRLAAYSVAIGINAEELSHRRRNGNLLERVVVADASKPSTWPADITFDIVITDPPYGFNTDEKDEAVIDLYSGAIRAIIARLNSGGQLVLCLPDRSYTGRRIPTFVVKEWVTQQVLSEAELQGREVVNEALVVPRPDWLWRPPYYWESERALRRAILHFRFGEVHGGPNVRRRGSAMKKREDKKGY